MNSVFEEIWNGHVTPYASCGAGDPEVEELRSLLERCGASLEGGLDQPQRKLLENYRNCQGEYEYLRRVHAYREGFILACRLMAETLLPRG